MLIAICITLILGFVLSFSIISEVKAELDLYGNKSVSFYLFGFRVIRIDIDLALTSEEFKLTLSSKDKELASIDLASASRDTTKKALSDAMPNPFYNLDIIEVDVKVEYGGDNAFYTAMIAGAMRGVLAAALFYLITTQRVRTLNRVTPNFDKRTAKLDMSGIFSITVADIIYGIIFGKKGEKQK